MRVRLFLCFTGAAWSAIACGAGAKAEDLIFCKCLFEQSSGYTAVGTRAVCSTLSTKNVKGKGEDCVISFGATGYDEPAISRLNSPPANYRELAFQVTAANLSAVANRDFAPISTAEYLRVAIPAYMRAAYLRADAQIDGDTVKDLDNLVTQAASQYGEQIAQVFQGKQPRFEANVGDRLAINAVRGAVHMRYRGQIDLAAVFFEPEKQR